MENPPESDMALTILIVTAIFCAVSVALGMVYGRTTAKTTKADLATLASLKAEKETLARDRQRITERLDVVCSAFNESIASLQFVEKLYEQSEDRPETEVDLPAYLKERISALESLSRGWEPKPDTRWLATLPQEDEEGRSEELASAQQELARLQEEVLAFRIEHEEARTALKRAREALAEAREGIAVLESHRNEVIGEIVIANQERDFQAETTTTANQEEAVHYLQRIAELEAKIAQYQAAEWKDVEAVESREKSIQEAEDRLRILGEAIRTAELRLQEVVREAADKPQQSLDKDLHEAQNRLSSLEEAIDASELYLKHTQEEVKRHEAKLRNEDIRAAEDRLLSLFESIRNAEQELSDRTQQLEGVSLSEDAQDEVEASARAAIETLNERLALLKQETETREMHLRTLDIQAAEERLRELRLAIAEADTELAERRLTLDTPALRDLSTLIEERKAALAQTEQELMNKQRSLEAWNSRSESLQRTLEQHLETRKAAQEAILQEIVQQTEAEKAKVQDELSALRREMEYVQKAQEKARAQTADLEAIFAEKQEDLAHITRTLSQREATLALLRSEISALRHEVVQSRTEYQNSDEAVLQLKANLVSLSTQKAEATRSVTEMEVEKRTLLSTVEALKQEAKQYETSMQSIRAYVEYVQQREAEVTKREQELREREALARRQTLPDPVRPSPAPDRPRYVRLGQRNF